MRFLPNKRGKALRLRRHQYNDPNRNEPIRASGNKNSQSVSKTTYLRHHPVIWFIPAALLVLALLPWPYGYYQFLRLVVCAVSAWLAYVQWKNDEAFSFWTVSLSATALLYNPILPIHLTREIWIVLNLLAAALFFLHFRWLKKQLNAVATHSLQDSRPISTSSIQPIVEQSDDQSPNRSDNNLGC